jgi:beta-glucosidase
MTDSLFPSDFLWGSATASYQIEGAPFEDGKGESIWDRFTHTPGKINNGDTGDVACDHYHRYPEDIEIMRTLGLHGYRFSIGWPRILPQGDGAVNQAGLDFYDRLVDALLAAGITPMVTLYHWDLPQALQDRQGGWASRAIVPQFAHFADVVSRCLGDRVKLWATLNEPHVVAVLGYERGIHAPGLADPVIAAQVTHHLLVAHGTAVPVLRANVGAGAQVGIVNNQGYFDTLPDASADDRAQRDFLDAYVNCTFMDPIFHGHYPEAVKNAPGFAEMVVEPGDWEIIQTPIDFVGINYYSRHVIGQARNPNAEYTTMGWEVYPDGLHHTLMRIHQEYKPKALYIAENGAAFDDRVTADGHVHDERRAAYLREHFRRAAQAIQDGVPLRGYFVWSLLDNFEWAYGYSQRFGIVRVDYGTGQRIVKDSALYYQSVIQANGVID